MSPGLFNGLLLVGGVAILYFGAEWLVRGASRLATSLGISPIVVGLTVVSFGTSAPELAVALTAVLDGQSDIAVGNVLGSNLANIGLILGLTAMIQPMEVAGRVVSREIPIMLFLTVLLFPLMADGQLVAWEGGVLFGLLILYLAFVNRLAEKEPELVGQFTEFAENQRRLAVKVAGRDLMLVVTGSVCLVLGGTAIVHSAEFFADALGVPDLIVGLTVVAIGTSLPELATAVVAALRQEADIAVGNIIGSNIFNIAAILGITSLVERVVVSPGVMTRELPAVLAISFLVWPLSRWGMKVRRWEGIVLLTAYFGLALWLFQF